MPSHHNKKNRKGKHVLETGSSSSKNVAAAPSNASKQPEAPGRKVIIIPVKGEKYRMYAKAYFGEIGKKSHSCWLLVDSGSQLTWVTKKAYENAFKGTNISQPCPKRKGTFKTTYGVKLNIHIEGGLYEGTISLGNTYIQNQIFGIVDEAELEKSTREELIGSNIEGILGLGPDAPDDGIEKYDVKQMKVEEPYPTLLVNLETTGKISECVVGITTSLPDEGSEKGIFSGELYLGGRKADTYDLETLVEIPTVRTGNLAAYYTTRLDLKCGNESIMNSSQVVCDSGAPLTFLPRGVMEKYMSRVNKGARKEVLKYEKASNYYYLKKKDLKYLKGIEFRFSRGSKLNKASFMLPPIAQTFPQALTMKDFPNKEGGIWPWSSNETVYLTIRDSAEGARMPAILGLSWMIWHYNEFNGRQEYNKIAIAEIKDRKRL